MNRLMRKPAAMVRKRPRKKDLSVLLKKAIMTSPRGAKPTKFKAMSKAVAVEIFVLSSSEVRRPRSKSGGFSGR
jgi:hypothetical protein